MSSTCIKLVPATSHGIWQGDNPIDFSLSLLTVHIILVLTVTRVLALILKPLRQPRVIAEIIGGILLGPTALGKNSNYLAKIFTKQSISILTTFANMGLMFFLFMVGLELDLASLRRTGKQATAISIVGIMLPFAAGVGVSFALHNTINPEAKFVPFLVFMGVALSITAFPVLARILAERRLLTTDVGKMAIAAAATDDVFAWIFLALAVALSGTGKSPAVAVWILLCGVAFVIVMFVLVKPVMKWISDRSPSDQPVKEIYVCIAMGGVLVSGFVTDFIGIHGIFGAFVFGLIIPAEGHFAHVLVEKLEDFVSILMLPLFFAASGLQTNIGSISGARSFGFLILVIVTACGGKIIGVVAVSMAYGENFRKALTLGFLMNTKGLVELIVLNIGKERKVLNDEMFAIMVIMALFTTFITTPVVMALYKPARDQVPYKRRKLSVSSTDGSGKNDLRILACVHGMRNAPPVINLVETTRGTNKESFRLYILQLVELTERSSAIRLVQRVRRDGWPFSLTGGKMAVVDGISVAFGTFAHLNQVAVRSMTAISSLDEMHEDVCTAAADKRAAFIILPFHRYSRADGLLETINPGFQSVNQRVLVHAPCSVGILVDQAASGQQVSPSNIDQRVAVFFFGGPDDREAVALGLRMAEHPGISLTIVRFLPSTDAVPIDEPVIQREPSLGSGRKSLKLLRLSFRENIYQVAAVSSDAADDEAAIGKVKELMDDQNDKSERSVFLEDVYMVGEVLESVMSTARKYEGGLIIVGRGRRPVPAVATLSRRMATYAELGPIGDALTADVDEQMVKASVLVIQQYDPVLVPGGEPPLSP